MLRALLEQEYTETIVTVAEHITVIAQVYTTMLYIITCTCPLCCRGEVIATCDSEETTLYADIDLAQVDSVRTQIPVTSQKRWDLFSITDKTES